jgi:hypothetical protein
MDDWVAMPNHFYEILVVADDGAMAHRAVPQRRDYSLATDRATAVERFGHPHYGLNDSNSKFFFFV